MYAMNPSGVALALEDRWKEVGHCLEDVFRHAEKRELAREVKLFQKCSITGKGLERFDNIPVHSVNDMLLKITGLDGDSFLEMFEEEYFQVSRKKDGTEALADSVQFYDLPEIVKTMLKESPTLAKMFLKTQIREALFNYCFTVADLDAEDNEKVISDFADEILNYLK
jgi:hypothetical protein